MNKSFDRGMFLLEIIELMIAWERVLNFKIHDL